MSIDERNKTAVETALQAHWKPGKATKQPWTIGWDFPDLIIEKMYPFLKEVTIDEFNKAVSSGQYNNEKVLNAIETQNFGYFVTARGQLYRC